VSHGGGERLAPTGEIRVSPQLGDVIAGGVVVVEAVRQLARRPAGLADDPHTRIVLRFMRCASRRAA